LTDELVGGTKCRPLVLWGEILSARRAQARLAVGQDEVRAEHLGSALNEQAVGATSFFARTAREEGGWGEGISSVLAFNDGILYLYNVSFHYDWGVDNYFSYNQVDYGIITLRLKYE